MLEEKTRLAQLHSEELEIRDAFGDQKLEKWPMMPTKKVLRVTASEVFDGRVSQEFRVKDTDESSKGVSLLMGRTAATGRTEAQCILFDARMYSDLRERGPARSKTGQDAPAVAVVVVRL